MQQDSAVVGEIVTIAAHMPPLLENETRPTHYVRGSFRQDAPNRARAHNNQIVILGHIPQGSFRKTGPVMR